MWLEQVVTTIEDWVPSIDWKKWLEMGKQHALSKVKNLVSFPILVGIFAYFSQSWGKMIAALVLAGLMMLFVWLTDLKHKKCREEEARQEQEHFERAVQLEQDAESVTNLVSLLGSATKGHQAAHILRALLNVMDFMAVVDNGGAVPYNLISEQLGDFARADGPAVLLGVLENFGDDVQVVQLFFRLFSCTCHSFSQADKRRAEALVNRIPGVGEGDLFSFQLAAAMPGRQ